MPFARYVAIGDSATEGLDDPDPRGGFRGWADRLAMIMAAAQPEPLEYANLAIRGLSLNEIRITQFDRALAMAPDVMTIVGGVNDVLGLRADFDRVREDLAAMFGEARAAGITVITMTMPDPTKINPLGGPLVRDRMLRLNELTQDEAVRYGVGLLRLADFPIAVDPRMWADDRLHGSPPGHDRLARGMAAILGVAGADDSWQDPLEETADTLARRERLAQDLAWTRHYLGPWLVHGLRGLRYGEGIQAKRPVPTVVEIEDDELSRHDHDDQPTDDQRSGDRPDGDHHDHADADHAEGVSRARRAQEVVPSLSEAVARDAHDPLRSIRSAYVGAATDLVYFDGNSLGRPPRVTADRIARFVTDGWGGRLIRGWDEEWLRLPYALGDRIGALAGAAAGQTVVADSTTVLLYKLARAGVDHQLARGRHELVASQADFPTDRFLLESIAAERGCSVRWVDVTGEPGFTASLLADAVSDDTALVLAAQVDYRTAHLVDAERLTAIAHDAGALVLWDLCHSVGVVPIEFDAWQVDLAVGCTYKYLNGGPGAPAFGYVRSDLQPELDQPIHGWMGAADVFAMEPSYRPAEGIGRFVSGTPPIVGMLALRDSLELIESAGIPAVRAKSVALTDYAIELADAWLAPLGVELGSPRDHDHRGGHVTFRHPAMAEVNRRLWGEDVIGDFRRPDGLRIGLSPLSTSFAEVWRGMRRVRAAVADLA